MKRLPLLLTGPQSEQVRWALGAMVDYWCSEAGAHERDGKVHLERELPYLEAQSLAKRPFRLWLSTQDEINADLLYRLEVQLQDMADQSPGKQSSAIARVGLRTAAAIRRRSSTLAKLPTGGGYLADKNPAPHPLSRPVKVDV